MKFSKCKILPLAGGFICVMIGKDRRKERRKEKQNDAVYGIHTADH